MSKKIEKLDVFLEGLEKSRLNEAAPQANQVLDLIDKALDGKIDPEDALNRLRTMLVQKPTNKKQNPTNNQQDLTKSNMTIDKVKNVKELGYAIENRDTKLPIFVNIDGDKGVIVDAPFQVGKDGNYWGLYIPSSNEVVDLAYNVYEDPESGEDMSVKIIPPFMINPGKVRIDHHYHKNDRYTWVIDKNANITTKEEFGSKH